MTFSSLSFRQMLLSITLVLITSLSFVFVSYLFETWQTGEDQQASLEVQAALAANTLASVPGQAVDGEVNPLDEVAKSFDPRKIPPTVVVFRQNYTRKALTVAANSGPAELPGQLLPTLPVHLAFLGRCTVELDFVNRKGWEGGLAYQWARFGNLIGAFWGRPRQLTAAAPIPVADEAVERAVVVLREVRSPITVDLSEFGTRMLAGFLLGAIPAIFVGGAWARRIGAEIGKIMAAIDQVRNGRYEYRIKSERQDEIGEAHRGFNLFAETLERARAKHDEAMRDLLAAKKEADVAAEAKSDFLANMSHEIRTPMNGIIGTTTLLEESNPTPEQQEFLSIVKASGQSLLNIINDVLDYSKLDSAKMALEDTPMDVRKLVEEISDMFGIPAGKKNLELIHYVDPQTPGMVYGDFGRLRQVLVNLVGNALKFTESGSIIIQVLVVPGNDGKQRLQYSVKDSGIGIAADKLEAIFEPFQQEDISTTRKYGGSGLGLTISRRLTRLMGGDIRVKSEKGKGSIFYFELPFRIVPTQGESKEQTAWIETVRGRRAAIICRYQPLGHLVKTHYQRWGIECRLLPGLDANTGGVLSSFQPNLIVIDPSSEDATITSQFMQALAVHPIPAIVLGRLGEKSELTSQRPNIQRLSKPVKEKSLLKVTAEVCSGQAPEAAPAPVEEPVKANVADFPIPAQTAKPPVKEGGLFADRFPARILLVEDLPENQLIARLLLKKIGYTIDIANNGQEGVDAVRANGYDIVFMDLHMPVMGGLDATREIRGDFLVKNQPAVIGLTAHTVAGTREECLGAGMDDYITKPISLDSLRGVIERNLGRRKAA